MPYPRDNRARILEAAERRFAEQGFAATTVREILRDTGVTGPTLYHYFGSKAELLVTLLRERFEEFFERAGKELSEQTTPEGVLTRYAELVFEGLVEQSTRVQFVFSVLYGPRADLPRGQLVALQAQYGNTLAEELLRTAPTANARRVSFVALLFGGMIHGVIMQYLNGFLRHVDAALAGAIATRGAAMLTDDGPVPELDLGFEPLEVAS